MHALYGSRDGLRYIPTNGFGMPGIATLLNPSSRKTFPERISQAHALYLWLEKQLK